MAELVLGVAHTRRGPAPAAVAESVALLSGTRDPAREGGLAGLPGLAVEGLSDTDARALLATVLPGRGAPWHHIRKTGQVGGKWHNRRVKSEAEIKQTVIAILTSVRSGEGSSEVELFAVQEPRKQPARGKGFVMNATTPSVSVTAGSPAEAEALALNAARQAAEQAGRQALTAATYAMTLFHLLAAEFEAACPDADVQAFLQRRALEVAAGDEEAA
ncbi:MAG TPA: hypothetical protein VG253_05380 [Streptosporangiaceae bacterium]|nr:hypothetical protein [Streptosporangiaceae bacterium]